MNDSMKSGLCSCRVSGEKWRETFVVKISGPFELSSFKERGTAKFQPKFHGLRWAKSRDSYRGIAIESYRRDSNH